MILIIANVSEGVRVVSATGELRLFIYTFLKKGVILVKQWVLRSIHTLDLRIMSEK